VQPVASEHAAMIAPFGIGGRAATARVCAVDDIVMDQRCAVQKLHNGGEANRAAILVSRIARGQKQERWTHALPTPAEQIRSDLGDRWKCSFALARQFLFDQQEVVADQIKNLFSREQGDGESPELTLVFETCG